VSEYHEWQRWVDGEPVRRYLWVGDQGEIELDEGDRSAADRDVARADELGEKDWDDLELADEDTVMRVAAEWSVDPTTLGQRSDLPDQGLLGYARG
jgi:hypothetical protein